MIRFVGAGPGAVDLITVRGQRALAAADVVIYAGSLVNPELLQYAKAGCRAHNSASLTLEEVVGLMREAHAEGKDVVRLHTGDPSLYGAVREQMDILEGEEIPFEVIPGVSSFVAAAAALRAEFTLPGVSQTVILTRLEGRTAVPEKVDMAKLAAHQASMAVFLSSSLLDVLSARLLEGGCRRDAAAAIVYRVTWEDEKIVRTTVGGLSAAATEHGIDRTALVLTGDFLDGTRERSRLYHPSFSHRFREAGQP